MRVSVNERTATRISRQFIRDIFRHIASVMPAFRQAEVSVAFVNNSVIRRLNKTYRKKDKITDVLSFSELDGRDIGNQEEGFVGEIIIAVPYAQAQAKKTGRSWREEIAWLLIHGFFHLVGLDHRTKREEKRMTGLTLRVLRRQFAGRMVI